MPGPLYALFGFVFVLAVACLGYPVIGWLIGDSTPSERRELYRRLDDQHRQVNESCRGDDWESDLMPDAGHPDFERWCREDGRTILRNRAGDVRVLPRDPNRYDRQMALYRDHQMYGP